MAREDIRQRRLFHRTRSSSYAWPPFLSSLSPCNSSSFALLFIPSHSIATFSILFTSLPPFPHSTFSLYHFHLPGPSLLPLPSSSISPAFVRKGNLFGEKEIRARSPRYCKLAKNHRLRSHFSHKHSGSFFLSIVFTFLPKLDMGVILKNRKNILSKGHTIHFHSFPPPYQQDICSGILNPPLRPHIECG